jgi:hypothetical protein
VLEAVGITRPATMKPSSIPNLHTGQILMYMRAKNGTRHKTSSGMVVPMWTRDKSAMRSLMGNIGGGPGGGPGGGSIVARCSCGAACLHPFPWWPGEGPQFSTDMKLK